MQEDPNLAIQKSKKKKNKDVVFNFLMAQIVVSVLALLIVIVLKMIGGDTYSYSRAVFSDNFDQPIDIEQVLSAKQAQQIVAAQATVYGVGGESDQEDIPYFESIDDISSEVSEELSAANINKMCVPVKGEITCNFGYRIHPISGKYSMHTGIDIGADSGTNIVSVLDGTVKKTVENDKNYGNYIIITHSDSVETMYAHCSSLSVKAGQSVKKGETIAHVGSTGLSTGPHLHFEVRVNSIRLNPKWFVNL